MKVFPTYLFRFTGVEADIERRRMDGGESLSGVQTDIVTDGGGRVFCEFADPYLDDPDLAVAWRALTDVLVDEPMIVPLADIRHQFVGDIAIPPGGLPWWTEAEYIAGQVANATLASSAPLRATTLSISIAYHPQPLRAGAWLSIRHATMGHRAYRIREVVSQNDTGATVRLSHPLREATAAGTRVELSDPLCVMRLQSEMRSPTELGFANGGMIRLVEDFRGNYA